MAARPKVISKEMCRWKRRRPADPNNYSDEAERLRREAAETEHVETQRIMVDIAKLYGRFAETLETASPAGKA
jgi:hypothetical protein